MRQKPGLDDPFLRIGAIVLGTDFLWRVLELLIYGEVQPRLVDNIMAIVWIVLVIGAYTLGKMDAREETAQRANTHGQADVRLRVLKEEYGVRFQMDAVINGQTIALAASYPKETADKIVEYLSNPIENLENRKGQ